jgi:hypothetical protein
MEERFRPLSASVHEYFCQTWQLLRQGKLESLKGETRVLARLMLEHPQYQHFWEMPYSSAEMDLDRLIQQGEESPHLHLAIEVTILEQIESQKPREVVKAYHALLAAGVGEGEARHMLGRVFARTVWEISHTDENTQATWEALYLHKLQRVQDYPLNIVAEQMRQLA